MLVLFVFMEINQSTESTETNLFIDKKVHWLVRYNQIIEVSVKREYKMF